VFHWRTSPESTPETHPSQHTQALTQSPELEHFRVLPDGRLRVSEAARRHQGRYVCLAEGETGQAAGSVFLTVGVNSLHDVKMMALLMALTGCLTAITFALVVRLSLYIFWRCGCCICCTDELPPHAKRIKRMADSVDTWRAQQLESLRDNYNQQVAGIKDSCYQQVERIRDTYKGQATYVGEMRDYGAQQIEGFREQYLGQVRRVRDYSLSQMNRVHENYIFQRNRIRKFSSSQRVRLRETYKYQQKTLNKILENLPDLYLQNCRTGTCQRTESMMLPGESLLCQDGELGWPPHLYLPREGESLLCQDGELGWPPHLLLPREGDMPHLYLPREGDMPHLCLPREGDMPHLCLPREGDMPHLWEVDGEIGEEEEDDRVESPGVELNRRLLLLEPAVAELGRVGDARVLLVRAEPAAAAGVCCQEDACSCLEELDCSTRAASCTPESGSPRKEAASRSEKERGADGDGEPQERGADGDGGPQEQPSGAGGEAEEVAGPIQTAVAGPNHTAVTSPGHVAVASPGHTAMTSPGHVAMAAPEHIAVAVLSGESEQPPADSGLLESAC